MFDINKILEEREKANQQIQKGLYGEAIEKGGEGSRGGKVIGHTKSGKPIYAHQSADHESYKNFSSKDHEDSNNFYLKRAIDGDHNEKHLNYKAAQKHREEYHSIKHNEESKGGKVIGHTKSGKPIYENFDNKLHESFTKEDHKDARKFHTREMEHHAFHMKIKPTRESDRKIHEDKGYYHRKNGMLHHNAFIDAGGIGEKFDSDSINRYENKGD